MKRKYTPKSDAATMRRQRAQKRNFALYQIAGAFSNLKRIAHDCAFDTGQLLILESTFIDKVKTEYRNNLNSYQSK